MNNDENDEHSPKKEILRSPSKIRLTTKISTPLLRRNSKYSSLKLKSKKAYQDDLNSQHHNSHSPKNMILPKRRSSFNFGSPLPSPNVSVERYYNIIGLIGEGVTSKVYLGSHKRTGEEVAIKIIDKRLIISNKALASEVSVLKRLDHPNIVNLIDAFITEDSLQMVMELCKGQELFDEIIQRKTFTEIDAKEIVRCILQTLEYLHSKGISHGDIKPENIMFVNENDVNKIKLVDFGFAQFCEKRDSRTASLGTLGYKAPEIFENKGRNIKSDIWSVGVITYILLCGFPPFFSDKELFNDIDSLINAPFWYFFNDETESLLEQIKSGNVSFPEKYWSHVSEASKDFVCSLLTVDTEKRLSASEALKHPWMTNKIKVKHDDYISNERRSFIKKLNIQMKKSKTVCLSMSPDVSTENLLENHILRSYKDSPNRRRMTAKLADKELICGQLEVLRKLDGESFREYVMRRKNSFNSRKMIDEIRVIRKRLSL